MVAYQPRRRHASIWSVARRTERDVLVDLAPVGSRCVTGLHLYQRPKSGLSRSRPTSIAPGERLGST
jgi:hypothetical protein